MIPCAYDIAVVIAYYLSATGHFDMSLVVLHTFDCHLQLNELQSLTYRTVVVDQSPYRKLHLKLHWIKSGANQSVDVRHKMVLEILQRKASKIRDTPEKQLFPAIRDGNNFSENRDP